MQFKIKKTIGKALPSKKITVKGSLRNMHYTEPSQDKRAGPTSIIKAKDVFNRR